uniref:EF-hand domain-containing protein n=1 Tax=Haptolina brevifila TaxID=156173 RepID=A0A7S2HI71_9EUKA|mmetsp:Transcript_54824/g.108877  ORF Transcript_54824/g.108877 Transcript_54824/m.108877 type:complete len:458 (+) Transcript_54824:110-1483(+)
MPVSMSGAPRGGNPHKPGAVGAGGYVPPAGVGQKAGAYLKKAQDQRALEQAAEEMRTGGKNAWSLTDAGVGRGNAGFDFSSIGVNVNEDPFNTDMRNDTTIAAHRTAAKTGTSFDMADLVTHGHATKLPNTFLPDHHPAMQVISLTEKTMPGDVLGVSPRHPPVNVDIEDRMATIIRERSLDLVNLMDDFLKRPAYSKMPIRNRAFLDVPTFKRALCFAFGDQWTRLAMTSAEFKSLTDKHVKLDAAHGSQGVDVQGFGMPEPLVLWLPFAHGIQKKADGDKYTIQLRGTLSKENQAVYDKAIKDAKAAEAEFGKHDDHDIGFLETSNTFEAKAVLRKNKLEKEKADRKPIGNRGATVGEVNMAKKLIMDRLLVKNSTVRAALKDIDESGDGVLSRDEIKKMLQDFYLLKYFDFYTGQTRGDLEVKVVETLLDTVDTNGDGIIKYDEFANIVMAGAN